MTHLILTQDQAGGLFGGPYMLIMIAVFIAIFYFMILRPENKKKKDAEAEETKETEESQEIGASDE